MQNTERDRFKKLRSELPFNYATILFQHYRRKNMKISKSLIYKVAYGERINAIVFEDLLQLAIEHQRFLKRYRQFDKRLRTSKL